jgi:hypothetical protein
MFYIKDLHNILIYFFTKIKPKNHLCRASAAARSDAAPKHNSLPNIFTTQYFYSPSPSPLYHLGRETNNIVSLCSNQNQMKRGLSLPTKSL